ncbi:tetratricopeptide repeat protein [Altericista sp. CCNU0014]|uniref:tetratricopeptide repeat protein n=1 Tax=Altericista sp. CCNU0014 TaxID=3082949 RepID=UPI00384B9F4B
MLEPDPRDITAWMDSGLLHLRHFEYAEALNCFRQALILNPNLPEGWLQYGSVLEKLGCYGAAIAANNNAQRLYSTPGLSLEPPDSEPGDAVSAALSLQESSADYWLQRGHALCDEGSFEEAIVSYDRALALRPEDAQAWFGRGNMAAALGCFEDAIASYDRVVELQPSDYQAWNNRGYSLHRLERYEAAIASYDNAIASKPDCYPAWNNRGYALYHLGRYEAAIAEFDRALDLNPSYPEAWNNRANALNALGRLEEAIASYDSAIALKPDFLEAQQNRDLAQQALLQPKATIPHIPQAEPAIQPRTLEDYPFETFPEEHLEILLALSTAFCRQNDFSAAAPLIQQGIEKLERLLQNSDLEPGQFTAFDAKQAGFEQLQVDLLVPDDPVQALELAEACKNRDLNRVFNWSSLTPQIDYPKIQSRLGPRTAAIYWHLSPANLNAFILRQDCPLQVASSLHQGQRFEAWMQQWQQNYEQSRMLSPETAAASLWRQTMPHSLEQLSAILEIDLLGRTYLQGIDRVVLIPHRALHLLPLHALFPEKLQVAYLPCAQWLYLQPRALVPIQRLLNIEASDPDIDGASGPSIENLSTATTILLTRCYGQVKSLTLSGAETTQSRLVAALTLMSDCLHISGRCQSPQDAAQPVLALSDSEMLTQERLAELDLNGYAVVCLPNCEARKLDGRGIVREFVPTASGFLAAGAGHVMSTLWVVDELPRTILMVEFHRWLKQSFTPTMALAKAQRWLRTATPDDLRKWCQSKSAMLSRRGLDDELLTWLRDSIAPTHNGNATPYPFAHPFYWAGFTVTGQFPLQSQLPQDHTLHLQAFLEAIAAHREPAPHVERELQADLERVTDRIQQIVQKYPSLQKDYDAAIQKRLRGRSNKV